MTNVSAIGSRPMQRRLDLERLLHADTVPASEVAGGNSFGLWRIRSEYGPSYRVVDPDVPPYTVQQVPGMFQVDHTALAGAIAERRTFVILDPRVRQIYGLEIQSYLQAMGVRHFDYV